MSRRVFADERLSPGWMVAGVLMFGTALAAPVIVFQIDPLGKSRVATPNAQQPTKLVATETRPVERVRIPGSDAQPRALEEVLRAGPILPGVGIGDILLDTDVADTLKAIEEPSELHFAVSPDGALALHTLTGENFKVTLTSDPARNDIEAVTLSAMDCEAVRRHHLGKDTLPATREGLSLGSHASRVSATLGTPEPGGDTTADRAARDTAAGQGYPGMAVSYCPGEMLVDSIRVERLPPAPLIASRSMPFDAINVPELPDQRLAGGPVPAIEAPAGQTGAPGAPSFAALSTALEHPVMDTPDLPETSVASEEPAPLLALNGSAFGVGDAFFLNPESLIFGDAPRVTTPVQIALADTDPLTEPKSAPLARQLSDGVPAFLLAEAERREAALELSRRDRGTLQVRLRLIGFDPGGADGVFGSRTRGEIAALQREENLFPTGYVDAALIETIESRSEERYAAWAREIRRARQRERELAQVKIAKVPQPRNAPECVRDAGGQIISNQSFSCDVYVLEESLSALFSGRS